MLPALIAATLSLAAASPDGGPDLVTLHGSLGPVAPLRRADGEVHAVAVLHPRDARTPPVFVVLGPHDEVKGLRLPPGAHVVVRGRRAEVAGRPAVIATALARAPGRAAPARTSLLGARVPAPPVLAPRRGERTLGYEVRRGVFEGLDEVVLRGRRLQRVRLVGQVLLLDAPRWAVEALRLRAGDRLEVAGTLIALGARPVIVVDRLRVGDDPPVSCRERAARPRLRARAVDDAVTARDP